MSNITTKQYELLKLLAKTGYLTNDLLEQGGIKKKTSSSHGYTAQLLDGQYIGRIMVVPSFGFGRKVLYYITRKGAELVAEIEGLEPDDLVYSTLKGGIQNTKDGANASLVRADFTHKERYISLFMLFDEYLNKTDYTAETYHYYQRKNNKGTGIIVNGKNVRPDGIFFCEPTRPNQPTFVYLVEIHRHSDRRKIIKQLRQHAHAIEQKAIEQRFGIQSPFFVLSVFTDENLAVMRTVIEELQEYPEWDYMRSFFMFARLEDLHADFYRGFAYFGGDKKPLPPKI